MNDTITDSSADGDEMLSAVAREISHAAPRPHTWASIVADDLMIDDRQRRSARGVAMVAAVVLVVAGVAGTMLIVGRDDRAGVPIASDEVTPEEVWVPVIEQPSLSSDVDVIEPSGDAGDWVGRALFPLETPDGFTLESVSQGVGGDVTEQGELDSGDVVVRFIPISSPDDPGIVIETIPAGVGVVDTDTAMDTVVTGSGFEWSVLLEEFPAGRYSATAFARTNGAGAMVSLGAFDSIAEAQTLTESLLASLRLVRIDDIPADVIDMSRLPVVMRIDDEAGGGVVRAASATNGWCVVSRIGNAGMSGCGFRLDPGREFAVSFGSSWSPDDGTVTLIGMAAPTVARIEIDLADGTTITMEPTFPTDADGAVGFWAISHQFDSPIGPDGPVSATRVIDDAGDIIGTVADQ